MYHYNIAKRVGVVVAKRPWTVLLFATLLTVALGIAAAHLKLKSTFVDLLPDNFKSVQDLKAFQDEFGSSTYLTVLVEHENRDAALNFVRDFATRIANLPEVLYVDYKKPSDFFKDKTLWYLELEDLKEIDHRIVDYVRKERSGKSPIWSKLINFTDDPEPLDFSDIEKKYSDRIQTKNTRFLEGDYYEDANGKMIAFLVRPKENSMDLENNKKLILKVQDIEKKLDTSKYDKTLKIGYTGEYQIAMDHNTYLSYEIIKVLSIVFGTLIVLIFIYYRRLSAVFLLGLPLIASMIWSAGLTAIFLGHINMVTSFSAGALLGLGSDYGIYLLSRYFQERHAGTDVEKSLELFYCNTGRATVGACLTTLAAFVVLLLSGFKAFIEFGLIGIISMITVYVAMFTILPALVVICEHINFFDKEKKWFKNHPIFKPLDVKFPLSVTSVVGIAVVIIIFLWRATDLFTIEYDLKKIEDYSYDIPSLRLEEKADKIFSNSLRPSVIMATSSAEEKELTEKLERQSLDNPGLFKQVIALNTFVPEDQEAKRAEISKINRHWKDISTTSVRKKYEDKFTPSEMGISGSDLPYELKRLFVSPDAKSEHSLIYIISDVDRSNIDNIEAFGAAVRDIRLSNNKTVSAVGEWMVFYDIMHILNHVAPRIAVVTLIVTILILLFDLRQLSKSMVISFCLIVSMFLFAAMMVVLNLRFNILNVAVVPIIIGTGIDSFIHFYYRYMEEGKITSTWNKMAPSIFIANLTTIIGFGGFGFSANAGLRSIGTLAIVGIVAIIIGSLIFFPAVLQILSSIRPLKGRKADIAVDVT